MMAKLAILLLAVQVRIVLTAVFRILVIDGAVAGIFLLLGAVQGLMIMAVLPLMAHGTG